MKQKRIKNSKKRTLLFLCVLLTICLMIISASAGTGSYYTMHLYNNSNDAPVTGWAYANAKSGLSWLDTVSGNFYWSNIGSYATVIDNDNPKLSLYSGRTNTEISSTILYIDHDDTYSCSSSSFMAYGVYFKARYSDYNYAGLYYTYTMVSDWY